ncbi:methyltransferase-like protein 27 [Haliotis rufescens]|uniref:methyltransferase-like protein 27 n=1 Tax=Haliotis rufescens TaxID=6454 RepID=UPI001EAFE410|nr:methyltransferase-like protein 27 [Haliotis rufescens]
MSEKFAANTTQKERGEAEKAFDYLIGDDSTAPSVIIDRFSENSHQYEKVLLTMNFSGHVQSAQSAAEWFPSNREDVYVLDVAAGTGLCADKLYSHGFRKIDALEPSVQMLQEAKKKGIYGRYFNVMLGENNVDIKSDTYDAVTISGLSVMVMKRLPRKAFEELIRIVKPGGYIINTVYHKLFSDDGDAEAVIFRDNMKTLESQGKWKQVELRRFKGYVSGDDGAVFVTKVL